MKTEIYYFSGTGNSLHVGKELQKRIPGVEIIPIVSLLDRETIVTHADILGFVFPLHLTTLPSPVRQFIEKLDASSAHYIFSIVTRFGTFCLANICVERLLRKQGKHLNARFVINMASNSPTGIKPGKGDAKWVSRISKENVARLESKVQSHLDSIKKILVSQENYPSRQSRNFFLPLLERVFYHLIRNTKTQIDFVTDQTCTGCGICEEVCPSRKTKLHDSRPLWQKNVNCYYCYACFNFCPTQSILVRNKYSKKDGRYFHPDITARDIVNQKQITPSSI